MTLSLEKFNFLHFAGVFLVLKGIGFLVLYFTSIYTDFNPFFYSDNGQFLIGSYTIFDSNYGYSSYVKAVLFDNLHQFVVISPVVSVVGYLILIWTILNFKIGFNNKNVLIYVGLLALHPYLTIHDFKTQPNILLGYFLAFVILMYYKRHFIFAFLSIFVALLFTIWRPSFGLMFFGVFIGLVFFEKRYVYLIPLLIVGFATGFYSIEYSARLNAAMQAYDNVNMGLNFDYALQIARNVLFSLFAREKYLTVGFSVSNLRELVVFISLVLLLTFHILSIYRFLWLSRNQKLYLVLLLSVGPLVVSWLSISHMRYLVPYIPILILGWIYPVKVRRAILWSRSR